MPVIFQKWDELITTTINPDGVNLDTLNGDQVQELIQQSAAETEKVSQQLIEGIINRPDIRDKQQYVQVHQAILIRLLDKLFSYQQSRSNSLNAQRIYHAVGLHLDHALNFIEDFFSNYFDRSERVPASYFFVFSQEICRQLEQLKEILAANTGIDKELAAILEGNFNRYCTGEKKSCTYNELHYQRDLMKELLAEKVTASGAAVRDVLFYFNFNNDDYVSYACRSLNSLIGSLPTKREKLAALHFERKTINQLPTKLNAVFNAAMPALKQQVTQWIEEEIKYLEADPMPEPVNHSAPEPEDKIQTALSVAKLALLLKLMVIDKMITNRIVAQVLRITAKTVTTVNKENISFGSLETKYHNPERGTISAVKDMLFRWINVLNRL